MQERLQKIIAAAGIASRRKAEELIEHGRVRVNGELVRELGTKADAGNDHIQVDGKPLRTSKTPLYLMLNKPRGCVTTRSDPEGRMTVMDLLGRYRSKVYPVGRLDYNSEGLLLFTNDGAFADGVLSGKSLVPKTYQVKIKGHPTIADVDKLREGIRLDGRPTAPAKVHLIRKGDNPWCEVTLIEGRNNQIRRMFQQRGFLVEKLKRVKIGSLALGKLPVRQVRALTEKELADLKKRALNKSDQTESSQDVSVVKRSARPPRSPRAMTKSPSKSRRQQGPAGLPKVRREAAAQAAKRSRPARKPGGQRVSNKSTRPSAATLNPGSRQRLSTPPLRRP